MPVSIRVLLAELNFSNIIYSGWICNFCTHNFTVQGAPNIMYRILYRILLIILTNCARGRHNMSPPPASWPLTFWSWKWCSSHVCHVCTSVPILVFLSLSVLDLGPMYATDVRQTDRQTSDAHHRLMSPPRGRGITTIDSCYIKFYTLVNFT